MQNTISTIEYLNPHKSPDIIVQKNEEMAESQAIEHTLSGSKLLKPHAVL